MGKATIPATIYGKIMATLENDHHKIWLDKVLSLGGSVAMYVCWLFASHTHKVVTIEIIQSLKQSILIPGCQAVGILLFFFFREDVCC